MSKDINIKLFILGVLFSIIFNLLLNHSLVPHYSKNKSINEKFSVDTAKNTTVVICNYARPDNIPKIIQHISKNPYIDEIIVTHGEEKTYRDFEGAVNIPNYEVNSKYGGAQRFFAALESSNEKIIFLDDDLLPSHTLIQDMINLSNKDPDQIYGPHRRLCSDKGYGGPTEGNNYHIILTGTAMTSKNVVKAYMKNFYKYSELLENTHGNGEDITFNHSFITTFKKKPHYIQGELDDKTLKDNTKAYSSLPNHTLIRESICRTFFIKPIFAKLVSDITNTKNIE